MAIKLRLISEIKKLNKAKRYKDVLKQLDDLKIRSPKHSELLVERSIAYRMLGNNSMAFHDAINAILLDKMNEKAHVARGDCFEAKEDYQNAIIDYNFATMINPSYGDAYYKRAGVYYALGKFAEAFTDYNIAIILNKKDDYSYYGRAMMYHEVGKYDEAQKVVDDVLDSEQGSASVLFSYFNGLLKFFKIKSYF